MSVSRQRLAVSAVLVTALTVTVTAGCAAASKSGPSANPTMSTSPSASPVASVRAAQAGDLLISDGTATVTVNGTKVAFPTTVTDASWSPDRSRITFIDAAGNVDSTRLDGSSRVVLTKSASGVTRSHPTWDGDRILYTQTDSSGASNVEYAYANGWINPLAVGTPTGLGGEDVPTDGNSAASTATAHLSGGQLGETAFQHQGAAGPEVWVVDRFQRSSVAVKLADGSQPAISPDGTTVAYVGADGQIHLVSDTSGTSGKTSQTTVISAGLTAPTHLAWTPDGGSITFSTASSIESIPSNGSGTKPGAVRVVSKFAGVATYAGAAQDRIERLGFTDPVAGAIAVTQARYQTAKTYRVSQSNAFAYGAMLANPANPDAAALGSGYSPVLYTAADSLDPRTKAELLRLFGTPDPVYGGPTITIVGDTSLISAATEAAVQNLGYKTTRVSGADQYAVNASALRAANPTNTASVIVVSGDDPAAIATESFAGAFQVVVLTRGSTLPAAASTYLSRLASNTSVYVVGASAQSALTSWTAPSGVKVIPLVGADAAQSSAVLARVVFGSPLGVILVDPANAADKAVALTAAQQLGYAILLVDPAKGLEPATRAFLDDSSAGIGTTLVVGPTGTLSDDLAKQAASAVGDAENITLGVTYAG